MSVFAQYVPYELATGTWDERREEIADRRHRRHQPLRTRRGRRASCIARFSARPTSRTRIGLTGGHIFQGECLPDQMWDNRFGPRTPIPGVYLCGASTHPGGSVMAINGRNAAMAVHRDLEAGA